MMDEKVKVLPLDPLEEKALLFQVGRVIEDPKAFLESLKDHFPGAIVQAVDARSIVDSRQIQAAALQTLIPREKAPWIKDSSLRFLALLSIDRQVEDAIRRIGIRPRETLQVLIILITRDPQPLQARIEAFLEAENLKQYLSPPLEENWDLEALMERYEVSLEELKASRRALSPRGLSDLLAERMAILSLEV
jgi:tRNA threonylcarbamoyladenosine modification (KEOPS) complex Cgi121 subunit